MSEAEENKLVDLTCADFATELAAKRSVPGGGGAAAYAGALAAALGSMVGNFTTGKKRYAAYEDDVQRMLREGEALRQQLVNLVDEDARAFYPLSQAYGIPRDDPSRAEALEEATRGAIKPPVGVMERVCRVIDLLDEMGEKGSRMLLSDVGCGVLLARAALEAASLNVYVNTRSLQDREFAGMIEQHCDEMLEVYVPRAEAIERRVMDDIRRRG